jgi:hypothetical protein
MHRARIHLCNRALSRMAQNVKPRRQRAKGPQRVHVCNRARTSPRIALSLHCAIAFAVRRMSRPIFAPVVRMSGTPARLRPSLVVAVVGIAAKTLHLPAVSAFTLARRCGAEALIRNLGPGTKRVAAGGATTGDIHYALHSWGKNLERSRERGGVVGIRASNPPFDWPASTPFARGVVAAGASKRAGSPV